MSQDSSTGECPFPEHDWLSPSDDEIQIRCRKCGVGHSLTIEQTDVKRLRAIARVYPATGSSTVSQSVIEWIRITTEGTVAEMRQDGWTVDFEEIVLGTPDFSGSQRTKEKYYAGLVADAARETIMGMLMYSDVSQVLEDLRPGYLELSSEELALIREGFFLGREFGPDVVHTEMRDLADDAVREVRSRVPDLWQMLLDEPAGFERTEGMIRMVGMLAASFAYRRFGQKVKDLRALKERGEQIADRIIGDVERRMTGNS